jgi:hypothetical protein
VEVPSPPSLFLTGASGRPYLDQHGRSESLFKSVAYLDGVVNTQVSDPTRRMINRRLDRQKRARRRQSEKALANPSDADAQQRIEMHTQKAGALKQTRERLPSVERGDAEGRRSKVLRVLEGIPYWVIEDPTEISEFVNNHVRKEWEADIADQEDHEGGTWLASLGKRCWSLAVTSLDTIKLSEATINYTNTETGYNFRKRLEERKAILSRDLDKFGAVIRPMILRAEDNQLMDGYCRFHTLRDRGIRQGYVYLGTL